MNNMRITGVNFGARIRMQDAKVIQEGISALPTASSSAGLVTGSTALGSAFETAGTVADVLGTAFSAKASGINSSGIVPSAIKSATPYVTPATIISAENNPSLAGSFFSSIGSWLSSHVKIKENVKTPS